MTKAGSGNGNTAVQIADIPNFSETTAWATVMGKKVIIRALGAKVYRRARTLSARVAGPGNEPKSFIERVTKFL